ncbi:MAG: DegV family protein, partial [Firmicutes bacterium]|nr:DegV family protein [Bacillota bacterium]
MSIKIVTDSTAYLDASLQLELDINVIPLSVHFPDESCRETEVDYDYFYRKIEREGIIPTSSQPPQGEIEAVFRNYIAQGHAVLAIFISAEMSGTHHSALSARATIEAEYPSAQIEIIDSRTNCMAMGFTVMAAAQAAAQGKKLTEIAAVARKTMCRTKFYFVPAGLEYLKKGGRIGGAAALLGSLLQIRPILFVDQGRTELLTKARGTRAALERILGLLDSDQRTKDI